ncbi:MAG: OmpH family outer membrane protein [bacterium]
MKNMRKNYSMHTVLIIFVVTAFLLLNSVSAIYAQDEPSGRVAFIDLWAVFNVHPQKAIAENQLNDLAQSMQSELEERVREENLAADQQQELLKEYQSELSHKEQELIQEIIDSIKEIVVNIAEEKGIEMVLDQKNVIYGGYDLSEDVIEYINNEYQVENNDLIDTDENIIELDDYLDIEE